VSVSVCVSVCVQQHLSPCGHCAALSLSTRDRMLVVQTCDRMLVVQTCDCMLVVQTSDRMLGELPAKDRYLSVTCTPACIGSTHPCM